MITREDVAKRAGVSVSAVSRAMNHRGYVAKDKKEAIYKAVEELGYRPNPLSHSLKNRQTYQLCFFGADIYNSFYMELFNYMSDYAAERGYTMFLFSEFNEERVKTMLMDGMIVENDTVAEKVQALLGEQFFMPIVTASYGSPIVSLKRIPYVDVDTHDAVEIGLAYLKKMGHKKTAFATPYDFFGDSRVNPRHVAFGNQMRPVYGKRLKDYVIDNTGKARLPFARENFFEEGMNCADQFLARNCDATAVICFNDEFALGMIRRFEQMGIRIPDALSILGIDGIENRKYVTPFLSSVSLNIKEQAECCVSTLLDMIEGRRVTFFNSLKPYLVEGNSVRDLSMKTIKR
ncbi:MULTISPECIES: LacI family DNA-binding transcriptional regulator [Hungatella]|uniref:LacI family DNA-binding transcriptional regulator n=1 Tax=Hungatella hathewayi TaxID=154046 RepID=A0AAW9WF90_9FIRM|nr:LacI family DNA-binding transcriptional regulator [Hungatella hathewayi]MCQ4827889.1 LacI family transcriptional regulator [Hungatella sp. SL.1.14]MUB62057.1 LacI family DNA-binding transcriptional regulator [Hungatella hathewayi]CUQ04228.1 transcriptional regulator%2C LacI family [Hungatella hathewayi]